MSKITDAVICFTVTTIVTAIVLVIARSLIGITIGANELLVVIVAVGPINIVTQLILKKTRQLRVHSLNLTQPSLYATISTPSDEDQD